MNELALFSGVGGGILAGKLEGWRTVCAVEVNAFCARRLMQRQNEGHLPPFPIWDDVCTFRGSEWRGLVDVVSGGFPCQGISCAGTGDGLEDERSGLWSEMARTIGDVGPRFVLVENSPLLVSRGLDRVLLDLASMGYDARWGVVAAGDLAAPHRRERLFLVANSTRSPSETWMGRAAERQSGGEQTLWGKNPEEHVAGYFNIRMETEPLRPRVADGVAPWLDRLRAIGNGQVPAVARLAWNLLK